MIVLLLFTLSKIKNLQGLKKYTNHSRMRDVTSQPVNSFQQVGCYSCRILVIYLLLMDILLIYILIKT